MKVAINFTEIITNLKNSLDYTLKKKVNGDLIHIYPTDISQYQSIQKYLSLQYNPAKKDLKRSFSKVPLNHFQY